MPNNRLTVDRPFADQPAAKEILKHSKYLVPKALIPKATLLKIHGLAKEIIVDELGSEKEIVGLRIGYYAPLLGSEEVEQLYFVKSGKLPTTDEDSYDSNPNIEREILSSEFIFQLLQRIREEIIRQTPPIALESRALHIDCLFAVKKFNDIRLPSVRRNSRFSKSSKPSEISGSYILYINKSAFCCDSQGGCCRGKIKDGKCVCDTPKPI